MSKIIVLNNKFSKIEEEDLDFVSKLDEFLSFKIAGAQYTKAYQGYVSKGKFVKWDGIHRVLNSKLNLPNGLINKVVKFYEKHNKNVEVVDTRGPLPVSKEIDISDRLKELNMVPYDYQIRAMNAAISAERGILKLCTGAGKTLLAAMITAKLGKPTMVYVIGKDLLYQFYKLYCDIFGEDNVGIIGDNNFKLRDINIASIWTLGKSLGLEASEILMEASEEKSEKIDASIKSQVVSCLKAAKVHIVDECHMAACKTIQEIYKHINSENIYGMSGTPYRDDNADLLIEGLLGEYIINIPASELIEKGYLAKPIIKFTVVPQYPVKLSKQYQTLYQEYMVDNEVRNDLIIKAAKRLVEQNFQTLILFNNLRHGDILYDLLSLEIPCAMLKGSNSQEERDAVKTKLLNGELQCVLASRIFDIGVDIKSLSGLVLAGGGKSSVKALQRIGRVIRAHKGKKYAAIVDFVDNAKWLHDHSKARYRIYTSEEGFDVTWPGIKKK